MKVTEEDTTSASRIFIKILNDDVVCCQVMSCMKLTEEDTTSAS